jgi:hypothetical protein
MKNTTLMKAVDEVTALKLKVIDEYIDEIVDVIANIGNPEKLIGKKHEDWTPLDLQLLSQAYGPDDTTPLAKLIFSKEYEKVKTLEKEA